MYEEQRQRISAGASRFMRGEAIRRQCPACGRKAALGRRYEEVYGWLPVGSKGGRHFCMWSTATCRYCEHVDLRACPSCGVC